MVHFDTEGARNQLSEYLLRFIKCNTGHRRRIICIAIGKTKDASAASWRLNLQQAIHSTCYDAVVGATQQSQFASGIGRHYRREQI